MRIVWVPGGHRCCSLSCQVVKFNRCHSWMQTFDHFQCNGRLNNIRWTAMSIYMKQVSQHLKNLHPSNHINIINKHRNFSLLYHCLGSTNIVYRARQKTSPYNVLLIIHHWFKLILEYFAGVLNVHINIHMPCYMSVWLIVKKADVN